MNLSNERKFHALIHYACDGTRTHIASIFRWKFSADTWNIHPSSSRILARSSHSLVGREAHKNRRGARQCKLLCWRFFNIFPSSAPWHSSLWAFSRVCVFVLPRFFMNNSSAVIRIEIILMESKNCADIIKNAHREKRGAERRRRMKMSNDFNLWLSAERDGVDKSAQLSAGQKSESFTTHKNSCAEVGLIF